MRLLLLLLLTSLSVSAKLSPAETDPIQALLQAHKLADAESAAQALVAAHPDEAQAYGLLGSVAMAKGDADATVKAYAKAAELLPTSGEGQRQLGDAYGFAAQKAGMFSMMGLAKKCRIAYEKAVELAPSDIAAHESLMSFYQQAPGLMGGGMDKAHAQAAEIRKRDALRGHIADGMLDTTEKKFADAFTEFQAALKIAPDSYPALYQFGRTAAISGERLEEGAEALKKCLTLTPTPSAPPHEAVHWRLGVIWQKMGHTPAARASYQAAVAINPGFQQAVDALKDLD